MLCYEDERLDAIDEVDLPHHYYTHDPKGMDDRGEPVHWELNTERVDQWCRENLAGYWFSYDTTYYFFNDTDSILFRIRFP